MAWVPNLTIGILKLYGYDNIAAVVATPVTPPESWPLSASPHDGNGHYINQWPDS